MARLLDRYKNEIIGTLVEEFLIGNPMALPKIEKVVVSMGVGRAAQERKRLEDAVRDITVITGQKPKTARAKKSVSNFNLREGAEIGCLVTLRGERMYEFLDRFINIAMPRIRDFRGVGTKFDKAGNYSVGVADLSIFPEVNLDSLEFQQGLNVTMVIGNSSPPKSRRLLELMGVPFRRQA
ncbi:MAG: 50S ribosomal protein L5 [Planctomycetes bacterium]|nr:50S ribosomal protein L5 [Planctomycetota bacterium]